MSAPSHRRGPRALLAVLLGLGAVVGLRSAPAAEPASSSRRVRFVDFRGEIEPALAAYLGRSITKAVADRVDEIVFAIDSPGGRVDSAIEIVDAISDVPKGIRTTAWIDREAISAACFAAMACDSIRMSPRATIGDCQPILLTEEGAKPVGEKAETYLRARFRRLAEAKGRDPILAEKFVSAAGSVVEVREPGAPPGARRLFVPGAVWDAAGPDELVAGRPKRTLERVAVVVPEGRLLTLTATEAAGLGLADALFDDTKAFRASLTSTGAVLDDVTMSPMEHAGRWLLGLMGVLAGIVSLCLVLSLYQGIGTPAIVGGIALALLALVAVTADLSNGFAWFLVGAGVLVLVLEALFLPGTAIAGILGILSIAAGFLFLVHGTSLDSRGALTWDRTQTFLLQSLLAIGATAGVFVLLARLFPRLPFGGRAIVAGARGLEAFGPATPGTKAVRAGERGRAASDLRPSGRVVLGSDPSPVDVVTEGGFVEAGAEVEVLRVEGARIVVRPREPQP